MKAKLCLTLSALLLAACDSQPNYYKEKISERDAVLNCRAELAAAKDHTDEKLRARCNQLTTEYRKAYGLCPGE